jgi:hypothetical protein
MHSSLALTAGTVSVGFKAGAQSRRVTAVVPIGVEVNTAAAGHPIFHDARPVDVVAGDRDRCRKRP